jgi:hypothetical protein
LSSSYSWILFVFLLDSQGRKMNETVEEGRGGDLRQKNPITMDDLLLILLEN